MHNIWSKLRSRYGLALLLCVPLLVVLLGWTVFNPLLQWALSLIGVGSALFALIVLLAPMSGGSTSARSAVAMTTVGSSPLLSSTKLSSPQAPSGSSATEDERLPYVPRTVSEVYKRLSPEDFELFSAAVIIALGEGHRFLEHCGKSGDRGVDVRLLNRWGYEVIVQCKHYAPTRRVGQPDLRDFTGCTYNPGVANGYFVTTSTFTRAAWQWIYEKSGRIYTIDARKLEVLLQQRRREIALALRDIQQQQAS